MTRREVLELIWHTAIAQHHHEWTSYGKYNIDEALTALDKLEKEKMLEIVGEDKEVDKISGYKECPWQHSSPDEYCSTCEGIDIGINKAKAEIRKKVRL